MRVCICSPVEDKLADTFIRAHVKYVPGATLALFGDWPMWSHEGRRIIPAAYRLAILRLEKASSFVHRTATRLGQRIFLNYLRDHNIQIVLGEWAYTSVNVMEACEKLGIPLVTHIHGADVYINDVLEKQAVSYKKLFAMGSSFIYGAHAMKPHLLKIGVPESKLRYNPCGVDITQFTPTRPEENPPVFLSLARFADKKAPHLSLLAFERAQRVVPEARLIAIGEGYLLEACRQMAKALGLADKVQYLGRVPDDNDVAKIIKSGRAFIQHSNRTNYGDCEGTVISVLEACAAGLPVVATRHGGIRDTIVEGETGFLVDELDIEGQAQHMIRLAQDARLAGEMGRKARRRVEENYTMEKSIAGIQRILEEALQAAR